MARLSSPRRRPRRLIRRAAAAAVTRSGGGAPDLSGPGYSSSSSGSSELLTSFSRPSCSTSHLSDSNAARTQLTGLAGVLAEGQGRELSRIRRVLLQACPNNGSQIVGPLRRRHPQERHLRPPNETCGGRDLAWLQGSPRRLRTRHARRAVRRCGSAPSPAHPRPTTGRILSANSGPARETCAVWCVRSVRTVPASGKRSGQPGPRRIMIVSGRFQERAAERSVRISLGREPSPLGGTAGAVYAASSTQREPRRVARDNRGYRLRSCSGRSWHRQRTARSTWQRRQ